MKLTKTGRGFGLLTHEKYADDARQETRLVQESSAIGDYENSFDLPGSSFLWVGDNHHLNREEVRELVGHLNHWLTTGKLHPGEGDLCDDTSD